MEQLFKKKPCIEIIEVIDYLSYVGLQNRGRAGEEERQRGRVEVRKSGSEGAGEW